MKRIAGHIIALLCVCITGHAYADATDWNSMETGSGHILIDIEISGVPAKALLDTGAESIAVDVNFLKENNISFRYGKKLKVKGLYGVKEDVRAIKTFDVGLYGTDFPIRHAIPLEGEYAFQLIIGLPFFKNFIIQLDYPNSRMKLISRNSLDMKALANVDLRHNADNTALVVDADLENDQSISLLLDTGNAGGIILERSYAERRGWIEKYSRAMTSGSGIIKTIGKEVLVIPSFKFGPYKLEDVVVTVPDKDQPTNISRSRPPPETGKRVAKGMTIEGILGYDVLRHFVITLDAKTARMHIFAPE